MVRSPDGETKYSDAVAEVLPGNILTSFLLIICLDYILRISIDLMKENSLTLEKTGSKWYPVETIVDADYADDLALLENTPVQKESLLHSLKALASM